SEQTIAFSPDGRFLNRGALALEYRSGVDLANEVQGQGVYRIQGNTLEMVYSDGRRSQFTFFVHPENVGEARAGLIVIDGLQFVLEQSGSPRAAAVPPGGPGALPSPAAP